jgi:F0F1-type ATP synthase membrane subunit b/b'
MQSFMDVVPILVSREFGLNTDIFETNIINIAILVFGLFNFLGGILKTSMEERKQKIVESVQVSENRINEARLRFEEAQKQLDQVQLIISEIKNETKLVKSDFVATEFAQANDLITKQFVSASRTIEDREQLIIYYVIRQVLQLTLFQAFRLFLVSISIPGQHQKCLNDSIHLFVAPGGKL